MHWIEEAGLIAVVRLPDLSRAVPLAEALADGGVRALEFTYTNREAGTAIDQVRRALAERCRVGAGTVLDAETARQAILSGAEFIVTPTLRRETIELCLRYAVPSVIGAFTPTEILTAWESGADYVKVFPAGVAGPEYFKDVLGPLPQVKLIPTGGVTLESAPRFLRNGAVAVAAGGNLINAAAVAGGDWQDVRRRAEEWVRVVRDAQGAAGR